MWLVEKGGWGWSVSCDRYSGFASSHILHSLLSPHSFVSINLTFLFLRGCLCARIPGQSPEQRGHVPSMRFSQSPPTLLSLIAVVLSSTHLSSAKPYPREAAITSSSNATLELRQCSNPCGWSGQLCCASNQYCYTDANNQAQCGDGAPTTAVANGGGGQWQLYTTTYVETNLLTVTTTYSLQAGQSTSAPSGGGVAICNTNLGQSSCGSICCAAGQYCQYSGQCGGLQYTTAGAGTYIPPTASNSAFIRPTTATVVTVTSTGTATTTVPFQTPIGTDGSALSPVSATPSNNGLSAGAIAGIVIGVLAGLLFLLLLCACLCCKSILDGLLAIFGFGKKKRVEETYIESHHHSHGSGAPPPRRRWFGVLPARAERPPKKSSGTGGLLGVAGLLGTLAIILGLKRKRDRAEEKSSYTGSSYTYSDYTTSESELIH